MAKSLIASEKLIDALAAAGIVDSSDNATRVVIDLQVGEVPVIHVQRFGDERMLNLVPTLEGVEIRREYAADDEARQAMLKGYHSGTDR